MKCTFLAENLQKKLPFVNKAISTRSQLPILLNYLLEVTDGKMHISATDLEIGIRVSIPVETEEEGKITIPARVFSELITSLPAEKIEMKLEDTQLVIRSKKSRTVFPTMQADEFPKLYEEKGEEIAVIKGKDLKTYFIPIIFAASLDLTRPALSGVLLKREEETFLLVATDGYRLSLRHSDIRGENKEQNEEESFLIPARILREVVSLKQESKDIHVFVSKKQNQVLFYENDMQLIGRLIDAQFPNFRKIIPQDTNTTVTFDREEIQKAVKICAIFARDSANIIKLQIKKDKIILSANTASVGENTVEVEAQTIGEENEIAFNIKYLIDLFANCDAKEMTFEMTGPLNPGVFKIPQDPSFLHLIMPIRVQG